MDGKEADSCYEWCSYRPSTPRVSKQTDIFAYGCMAYEVMTDRPPYFELESSDDRYQLVEQRYTQGQFPNVAGIPLGELIQSCWHSKFDSMDDVLSRTS